MKRKNIPIIVFIIVAVLSTVYIVPVLSRDKTDLPGADDIEKAEDLIIIEGINHNSDTPVEEDDFDIPRGTIIYDDTFDDNIIETDTTPDFADADEEKHGSGKSRERAQKPRKKTETPESIMKHLRAKDSRWHLTEHKITKGENLWDISKKYDTDHRLIIKINNIRNPDRLYTGNTIRIPNRMGVEYKVKEGDYLIKISRLYGVDIAKILSHNSIQKNLIKKGETLFLPDAVPLKKKAKGRDVSDRICNDRAKRDSGGRDAFFWPLKGRITSAFGSRINPVSKKRKFHCGIDIGAVVGTPVKASRAGRVIFSGYKDGYGRVVILKHRNGYITVYAHNHKNIARHGERVKAGAVIALSGQTGAVTGPHLHFELRKYLTPLNPLRFLK